MIVLINPSIFYTNLGSNDFKEVFINSNVTIAYVFEENGNYRLDGCSLEQLISADRVFIDDYFSNPQEEIDFITSNCKLINRNFKIESLVDFWERHRKMAAIFESNERIFYPYYIDFLEPSWKYEFYQRLFDLVIVMLVFPVALIIVLISIFILYFMDGIPLFFIQDRVGKNSKSFALKKIRTMMNNSGERYTTLNDNRIFPFGKLLRRMKIDEIPQLLNILNGNMSLIGPRPERVDFHTEILKEIVHFDKRLLIKPGITGWAQVNVPTATPKESLIKLKYDIFFIKNVSFLFLIKILYETVFIILSRKSL